MKSLDQLKTALLKLEDEELLLEQSKLQLAIQKGKVLNQIKEQTPHGQFGEFLKSSKVKTSERTAQREMNIAKHEDLLKEEAGDNFHKLTLKEARAIIRRKTKADKPKECPMADVDMLPLSIKRTFNPETQNYEIAVCLPSLTRDALANNPKVLKEVEKRFRESLKVLIGERSLVDTTGQEN